MSQPSKAQKSCCSGVGAKYVMALTGLALMGFILVHLVGNLFLYLPDSSGLNVYAHQLESLGALLIVAEIGLIVIALVHVVTAIQLKVSHHQARPEKYGVWASKAKALKTTNRGGGEDSSTTVAEAQPSNFASRNMIASGLVILVFIVVHVWHIKFGPGVEQGYVINTDGVQMRDLNRWVKEAFQNPLAVVFYSGVMLFLGLHLRHGFWSAIQSLGLMYPRFSKCIHGAGLVLAVVVALGFFFIPPYLYLRGTGILSIGQTPGGYQ